MKIEYQVLDCDADAERGMKHGGSDLSYLLFRRNQDGSREVVARFHASFLARQFAAVLNKEVRELRASLQ